MNQKLRFLYFWGIHNSLPSFWAKLGYSRIKIDHFADSLLKLQIKIGVHLISVELTRLLTLANCQRSMNCFSSLLLFHDRAIISILQQKRGKRNNSYLCNDLSYRELPYISVFNVRFMSYWKCWNCCQTWNLCFLLIFSWKKASTELCILWHPPSSYWGALTQKR